MKRRQILDAAYTVFSRKGYHRATVDEIIALADTGKGTVYKYFVNKEQLFYTLITERSSNFEKELKRIATLDEPPLDKVKQTIRVFLEFYVANGDLWRVLMHEMWCLGHEETASFTEAQRKKYRERFAQNIGMLQAILQEGIEQGTIRNCDIHKAAYGLYSVIVMVVFQGFVADSKESIDEAAERIADIFLYGVAKQS